MLSVFISLFFFFFNDTATTEIYTLSLHDALPISSGAIAMPGGRIAPRQVVSNDEVPEASYRFVRVDFITFDTTGRDRKSTRLNSSHLVISYAVFCLKKKKKNDQLYVIRASVSSIY